MIPGYEIYKSRSCAGQILYTEKSLAEFLKLTNVSYHFLRRLHPVQFQMTVLGSAVVFKDSSSVKMHLFG